MVYQRPVALVSLVLANILAFITPPSGLGYEVFNAVV